MTKRLTATFDGQVLRPDTPLDLQPNTRCVITVEVPESQPRVAEDAWTVLEKAAGSVDAPRDWSAEHDHYLYGTPKRRDEGDR